MAGTVVITAAALPGAGRAQFTVSAVITGGTPGTVYDLIGNDCSDATPLPNKVWATGLAGPDGTASLTGYAWAGAVRDRCWMILDPAPGQRPGPARAVRAGPGGAVRGRPGTVCQVRKPSAAGGKMLAAGVTSVLD